MIGAIAAAIRAAVVHGPIGVAFVGAVLLADATGDEIHEQPDRRYDIALEFVEDQ